MTFNGNKHVVVLTVEVIILNFVFTKFNKHNLTLHFSHGYKDRGSHPSTLGPFCVFLKSVIHSTSLQTVFPSLRK